MGRRTFWTVLLLGVLNWLNIYSGEQTLVQRYASASSLREARKATLLFLGHRGADVDDVFLHSGTALFVFFTVFPDATVAKLQPDPSSAVFCADAHSGRLGGPRDCGGDRGGDEFAGLGVNSISTVVVIDLVKRHFAPGGAMVSICEWRGG